MSGSKGNLKIKKAVNRESRLDKALKLGGFGIAGFQLVVSIMFMFLLITLQMVPMKYCIAAAVVLIVLAAVVFVTQKWRVPGIITKVISVILSVILIIGCVYLGHTKSAIDKMTNTGDEKAVMGVYVLNESDINEVAQLNGKDVGVTKAIDKDGTEAMTSKISGEGVNANFPEYNNMMELATALTNGEVPAIVLKSSNVDVINDMEGYDGFSSKVRMIYSAEVTVSEGSSSTIDTTGFLSNQDVITVYVTGIDSRGSINEVSRSDVNILMAINKKTHHILMINTPRDYYVPLSISNGVKDKLTHSGIYGVQCSVDTLSMLYGIKIDYYVKVNFSGFENIIDSLGGVDVTLDYNKTLSQTMEGGLTVHEGVNHFNGAQALAFARERHAYADGDRQRGRNQMMIIEAAIKKACTPAIISNYTSVLSSVSDSVIMNIPYDELSDLAKMQLSEMPSWNVQSISVSGTGSKSSTTYSMPGYNVYVMEPDQSTIDDAKAQLNALYQEAN